MKELKPKTVTQKSSMFKQDSFTLNWVLKCLLNQLSNSRKILPAAPFPLEFAALNDGETPSCSKFASFVTHSSRRTQRAWYSLFLILSSYEQENTAGELSRNHESSPSISPMSVVGVSKFAVGVLISKTLLGEVM